MRLPLSSLLFLLSSLAASALAQSPAASWQDLANRTDSLYVEGKLHHFRVPVDQDPADERNWIFNPRNCMIVEFRLWIRRPDFRIWIHDLPDETTEEGLQEMAWIDGAMTSAGDTSNWNNNWVAEIRSNTNQGRFQIEPFLTPFHLHLFDWRQESGPEEWLKKPHQVDGNQIAIELKSPDEGYWLAGAELDPDRQYCPTRLSLLIGKDPQRRVSWDMHTLETKDVDGVPVITKARITLFTPTVNPEQRVLYLYEASKVEKRPITRVELELKLPKGVTVHDMRNKDQWKTWVVGDSAPPQNMDMDMVSSTFALLEGQAPVKKDEPPARCVFCSRKNAQSKEARRGTCTVLCGPDATGRVGHDDSDV